MSNCNCFNEELEKLKTAIVEKILPKNAEKESLKVDWKNRVLRFDGSTNNVVLRLDCSYQRIKVNGEPYRHRTDHPVSVRMQFCPFCGTSFGEQGA